MTQYETQNDRLPVLQRAKLHDCGASHAQRRNYRSKTSFSVRVEPHGLLLHVCGSEELVEGWTFTKHYRGTGTYELERTKHTRRALIEWQRLVRCANILQIVSIED